MEEMKFLADRTVGKLAKKLRLLGLDVADWREGKLLEAAEKAKSQERILLTRSRRIKEEKIGIQIFMVGANDPQEQAREVLTKFGVEPNPEDYFSRCLRCNEELRAIAKEEVQGGVPDFIYRQYDSFHCCPRCRRIYWPGSHLERMKKDLVKTLRSRNGGPELPAKQSRSNADECS